MSLIVSHFAMRALVLRPGDPIREGKPMPADVRIDPPYWWAGMNNPQLQLMIHGKGIGDCNFNLIGPETVTVDSIVKPENENYMFVYLNIAPETEPCTLQLQFTHRDWERYMAFSFELKARKQREWNTFSSADVMYLLMPDRFAQGPMEGDGTEGLNYPIGEDRDNPNGRHGGNLSGIEQHLNYIDDLGMTAIWLTPVLENDMPGGSYHGYATTDYYRVDPRFGTNDDYFRLISKAHEKGLKVVMDMIFNHSGIGHPWIKDMPMKDWYNHPDGDVTTNFRLSTVNDPYASRYDYDRTVNGWFVRSMPDLNQRNPHLRRYLAQNSIWWIEAAQIDGIRMDTYPYADFESMADWLRQLEEEFPSFNVVGECWYGDVSGTAYWQRGSRLHAGADSRLRTVMDFPTMIAAPKAFTEETTRLEGLNHIYNRLSLDYLYEDPMRVLTFLDNHDSDRFLREEPTDLGSWKQAITWLLTTRGIPQVYYGTELLMNGSKEGSDGFVRRDMPGGWAGDATDAFSAEGRTPLQQEAWDFMSRLAQWRRGNDVIAQGSLIHFMPENGLYVYQRAYDGKKVTVMMNGTSEELEIDMSQYAEIITPGEVMHDVISDEQVEITPTMSFSPRAICVLEH